MKKYIVLGISGKEEYEVWTEHVHDSREEAVAQILDGAACCEIAVDRDKDLCPNMAFECREETSGDFDYSFWYIDAGVEECDSRYKIIEVEL